MDTATANLLDLLDRAEALVAVLKGDYEGHPFRGNQYTEGGGSGGDEDGGGDTGLSGGDSDTTQRMGIAENTARELGVSPDSIEYGGDGYAFSVGDDNFIAAGQFDPSTGKITLYKGALNAGETELKGITAHEVQHAKFNEVFYKKYQEEMSAINEEFRANDYANADNIMYPSGRAKGEYADKYPVYAALQSYMQGAQFDQLVKKDGITSYSTSYWKAFKAGKVSSRTAINETLSEVAHQKAVGIRVGIPNVWRNLYNEVNAQYDRMKAHK